MSSRRATKYFPFKGGINSETSALTVSSGELIDALNYEPVTEGGYRRVDGYERYDGHIKASTGTYYYVEFVDGEHEVFPETSVVGASSGAIGVVAAVVVESGAWATNDADGYFAIVVLEGMFENGEEVTTNVPVSFSAGFNEGFY